MSERKFTFHVAIIAIERRDDGGDCEIDIFNRNGRCVFVTSRDTSEIAGAEMSGVYVLPRRFVHEVCGSDQPEDMPGARGIYDA